MIGHKPSGSLRPLGSLVLTSQGGALRKLSTSSFHHDLTADEALIFVHYTQNLDSYFYCKPHGVDLFSPLS